MASEAQGLEVTMGPISGPVTAIKADRGKPDYSLLSPVALHELAVCMTIGAEKYGVRNWERDSGLRWGRLFAAAMRHLWAWWNGEDRDIDGVRHLAAVMANVMMLLHYCESNQYKDGDDRPQ